MGSRTTDFDSSVQKDDLLDEIMALVGKTEDDQGNYSAWYEDWLAQIMAGGFRAKDQIEQMAQGMDSEDKEDRSKEEEGVFEALIGSVDQIGSMVNLAEAAVEEMAKSSGLLEEHCQKQITIIKEAREEDDLLEAREQLRKLQDEDDQLKSMISKQEEEQHELLESFQAQLEEGCLYVESALDKYEKLDGEDSAAVKASLASLRESASTPSGLSLQGQYRP